MKTRTAPMGRWILPVLLVAAGLSPARADDAGATSVTANHPGRAKAQADRASDDLSQPGPGEQPDRPAKYRIQIQIAAAGGRIFRYRGPMEEGDYDDALTDIQNGADSYVIKAKAQLAEELGYTRARYGKDNWKMLTDPNIVSITLWDVAHHRGKTFDRPFERRHRGGRGL